MTEHDDWNTTTEPTEPGEKRASACIAGECPNLIGGIGLDRRSIGEISEKILSLWPIRAKVEVIGWHRRSYRAKGRPRWRPSDIRITQYLHYPTPVEKRKDGRGYQIRNTPPNEAEHMPSYVDNIPMYTQKCVNTNSSHRYHAQWHSAMKGTTV